MKKIEGPSYEYASIDGTVCFKKTRFDLYADESALSPFNKQFKVSHRPRPQRQPYRWCFGIGPYSKLLYRYPELVRALRAREPVLLGEGEKDCDNAFFKWGMTATTHHQGNAGMNIAQAASIRRHYRSNDIYIIVDRDLAGAYIGMHNAQLLEQVGVPASHMTFYAPGIHKNKADLSDHIYEGLDFEDLEVIDRDVIADAAEEFRRQGPQFHNGSGPHS